MKTLLFNQPISVAVGMLTLFFRIPECRSLKEKRSVVKPILAKIQNEFKISASEVGYQDAWQESLIACSIVSGEIGHCQSVLQNVYQYVSDHFHDIVITDHKIEIF